MPYHFAQAWARPYQQGLDSGLRQGSDCVGWGHGRITQDEAGVESHGLRPGSDHVGWGQGSFAWHESGVSARRIRPGYDRVAWVWASYALPSARNATLSVTKCNIYFVLSNSFWTHPVEVISFLLPHLSFFSLLFPILPPHCLLSPTPSPFPLPCSRSLLSPCSFRELSEVSKEMEQSE